MLAKMWKKVLLAVCIIACIYNVMSKLVNRASLEANLKRANDGNTVFDFSSKVTESKSETIDNNAVVNENNEIQEPAATEPEELNKVEESEVVKTEVVEDSEKGSSSVSFKDYIFKW